MPTSPKAPILEPPNASEKRDPVRSTPVARGVVDPRLWDPGWFVVFLESLVFAIVTVVVWVAPSFQTVPPSIVRDASGGTSLGLTGERSQVFYGMTGFMV